ncbi:hypothetical protein B0H67DRAFT_474493 [Lasiosphaeris hirsuta]|uniref:Fe2OG dioxygenase domain-containing protein n=1 Tax=Lasiosphaeris hirsuta TaxID=260670 RepID=A0AA40ED23_9PEZI|nr:hypothetical protein B0H67DRAFT_474493 [Lasiosphaeris hirsuta]
MLPPADHFEPVGPTKEALEFVSLVAIDLGRYGDGPEARNHLADQIRQAMVTQGFFFVVNHGIAEADITRQVDIGYHILKNTSDDEKQRLRAPIIEEGSYHGFKPRGHWRTAGEVRDKAENFNVYRDMSLREQPTCMEPFRPEIQHFIERTHKDVLGKLLRIFAIALEINDEDFFVKLHSYDGHDETFLRYMQYYDAFSEEERKITKGLWFAGHQDLTSLSLLFSQPMTSLQVREYESDQWKYVPHIPGAIIVNAGEVMAWWTGNYFKAAIHRVVEPPADQRGHDRCSIFYFCVPNDEVVINTLLQESPVLRAADVAMAHLPDKAPNSKDWANDRIKISLRNAVWAKTDEADNVIAETVGNVATRWFR